VSDPLHDGNSDGPVDEHERPAGGGTGRAGRRPGAGRSSTGWGQGRDRGSDRSSRRGFGGNADRGSRRPVSDDADSGGAAEMADPEAVARDICLRALTGAMKTRKQLADVLAKKDVPEAAATAVLDRLTEVGLIDDAAFAEAWVSSRQSGRGLAKRALAQELRAKGVDGELAEVALEQVDPQDEWDTARRLVARKLPSMSRLDRVTAERRLVGMLARKGYGGGLAGWVVREALDERDAELNTADEAAEELEADDSAPAVGAWSGRRRAAPPDDPWAAVENAAPEGAEVGEGKGRGIARRSTAPAPAWLVDDTP
jgi:SOS response regulatory protein OraA/RecX